MLDTVGLLSELDDLRHQVKRWESALCENCGTNLQVSSSKYCCREKELFWRDQLALERACLVNQTAQEIAQEVHAQLTSIAVTLGLCLEKLSTEPLPLEEVRKRLQSALNQSSQGNKTIQQFCELPGLQIFEWEEGSLLPVIECVVQGLSSLLRERDIKLFLNTTDNMGRELDNYKVRFGFPQICLVLRHLLQYSVQSLVRDSESERRLAIRFRCQDPGCVVLQITSSNQTDDSRSELREIPPITESDQAGYEVMSEDILELIELSVARSILKVHGGCLRIPVEDSLTSSGEEKIFCEMVLPFTHCTSRETEKKEQLL